MKKRIFISCVILAILIFRLVGDEVLAWFCEEVKTVGYPQNDAAPSALSMLLKALEWLYIVMGAISIPLLFSRFRWFKVIPFLFLVLSAFSFLLLVRLAALWWVWRTGVIVVSVLYLASIVLLILINPSSEPQSQSSG